LIFVRSLRYISLIFAHFKEKPASFLESGIQEAFKTKPTITVTIVETNVFDNKLLNSKLPVIKTSSKSKSEIKIEQTTPNIENTTLLTLLSTLSRPLKKSKIRSGRKRDRRFLPNCNCKIRSISKDVIMPQTNASLYFFNQKSMFMAINRKLMFCRILISTKETSKRAEINIIPTAVIIIIFVL
jgi:hypothetical protein